MSRLTDDDDEEIQIVSHKSLIPKSADLIKQQDEEERLKEEYAKKSIAEKISVQLEKAHAALEEAKKLAIEGKTSFSFTIENSNPYGRSVGGRYDASYMEDGEHPYWYWNNSSLNC